MCYNNLLKKMKMTLMTLEEGITSLMVIPPDIENMFEKIYKDKVPDQWLKSNIKTLINMLLLISYYIYVGILYIIYIFFNI